MTRARIGFLWVFIFLMVLAEAVYPPCSSTERIPSIGDAGSAGCPVFHGASGRS